MLNQGGCSQAGTTATNFTNSTNKMYWTPNNIEQATNRYGLKSVSILRKIVLSGTTSRPNLKPILQRKSALFGCMWPQGYTKPPAKTHVNHCSLLLHNISQYLPYSIYVQYPISVRGFRMLNLGDLTKTDLSEPREQR